MGDTYSNVGAVVGATYPEMGKTLRKVMPKAYILFQAMVPREEKLRILQHSLIRMDLVLSLIAQEVLLQHIRRTNMQSLAIRTLVRHQDRQHLI